MPELFLILLFLLAGVIARYRGWCKTERAITLNTVIIYLPLPAIVLLQIPFLSLDRSLLLPVITPWALMLPVVMLLAALKNKLGWSREEFACLLICCVLGNTAYLGYPMVATLLGDDALATAIIYDQLGNFLLLAIFTSVVIAWCKKDNKHHPVVETGRKIFSFPPFICLLLALFIPSELISGNTQTLLQLISLTLMPLAMFSIGLQLDLKPAKQVLHPMLVGLAIKMLLVPALVYGLVKLSGNWSLQIQTIVLQSAMPPSVAAGALAIAAQLAPRLCAAMVAYGMLLALVVLPLWALLLPGNALF